MVLQGLRKKWSFPLRISSVNVTKSVFLRIWSHLLNKCLMESIILCAVKEGLLSDSRAIKACYLQNFKLHGKVYFAKISLSQYSYLCFCKGFKVLMLQLIPRVGKKVHWVHKSRKIYTVAARTNKKLKMW